MKYSYHFVVLLRLLLSIILCLHLYRFIHSEFLKLSIYYFLFVWCLLSLNLLHIRPTEVSLLISSDLCFMHIYLKRVFLSTKEQHAIVVFYWTSKENEWLQSNDKFYLKPSFRYRLKNESFPLHTRHPRVSNESTYV